MLRVALTACALSFFLGSAGAQSVEIKNDPKYPLQIESVSPQMGPGNSLNGLKVRFANRGQAPIVALSVSILVWHSNSTKPHRITLTDDYSRSSLPTPLGPGQVHERISQGGIRPPNGVTITRLEAVVDYAETADGVAYGPDPHNVRQQFKNIRYSRRSQRERP